MEALIPNPDLVCWNSDPKIHFWANLGQKSQSYQFCLKICTHGIWRMLNLIPTLVFWICNPKSIFGQIWTKKVSCPFRLKIGTHSISRMLIHIPSLIFRISYLNIFLSKFGPKKSKLFVLPEKQHMDHLEDADSYCDISFLNFQP